MGYHLGIAHALCQPEFLMAMSKKSSRSRSSRPFYKKSRFRRALLPCALVLLVVLVLGGFWLLSQLGPQKVDYDTVRVVADTPLSVKELYTKSQNLELEFDEIVATREPDAKEMEVLKEALDLAQEYERRLSGIDVDAEVRRDELEKRYHNLMSTHLKAESLAAELDAERFAEQGDYAQAATKANEALVLQRSINEEFPRSTATDVGRVAQLERRRQFYQAEPLYQKTIEAEAQSNAFMADRKWAESEQALITAIELQDQLNRDFRGMKQSSALRLQQLRSKLSGIQSGQRAVDIERLSYEADVKQVAGAYLEAASLYQDAARLQEQLNLDHPSSPAASSARVADFLRKKETAESFELGREIERDHLQLIRYLRERQVQAATEVLGSLRRNLEQMKETFPLSALNDDELDAKVRYLYFVQNDLPFIQRQVDQALLPVPGAAGLNMLKTEVPQGLYELVMGANPSRMKSSANPVDSVNWMETRAFCERLSWILGAAVRLPSENEFRQALGPLRYLVLEEYAWGVEDADGAAHAVAQKKPFASGFYDLLGNLSEWLQSDGRTLDQPALHVGGDFQSSLETVFTVPVRELSRRERARNIGFRFVVHSPE